MGMDPSLEQSDTRATFTCDSGKDRLLATSLASGEPAAEPWCAKARLFQLAVFQVESTNFLLSQELEPDREIVKETKLL